MKLVADERASAILFRILAALPRRLPFLLPANACTVLPLTFLKAGVPFELCDIAPADYCIDEANVLRRLRLRPDGYAGLIYIHSYGRDYTPTDFFQRARQACPELLIVDDRCLCRPDLDTAPAAAVTLYSTGYAKYLDLGKGGFAKLIDEVPLASIQCSYSEDSLKSIEERVKGLMRTGGRFEYSDCDWLNCSGNLNGSGAYFQEIRDALPAIDHHKRALNAVYREVVPEELQVHDEFQNWRFNIRVKNRDQVLGEIFRSGLFASSHYQSLGGVFAEGSFPGADELHTTIVNLFNDRYYTEGMARRTALIVRKYGAAIG